MDSYKEANVYVGKRDRKWMGKWGSI